MADTAMGITAFRAPQIDFGGAAWLQGLQAICSDTSSLVSGWLDQVEASPLRTLGLFDPARMIRTRAEFLAGVSPYPRVAETFLDPVLRAVGGMSNQQFQIESSGDSRARWAAQAEDLLRSNMKLS